MDSDAIGDVVANHETAVPPGSPAFSHRSTGKAQLGCVFSRWRMRGNRYRDRSKTRIIEGHPFGAEQPSTWVSDPQLSWETTRRVQVSASDESGKRDVLSRTTDPALRVEKCFVWGLREAAPACVEDRHVVAVLAHEPQQDQIFSLPPNGQIRFLIRKGGKRDQHQAVCVSDS